MHQIKEGIYYEDSYPRVTLGALVFSYGTIYIDSPLKPEDARYWRSSLHNLRSGTSRLLICLDSHIDRTLGARSLDCTILAHQESAQTFRNRPMVFKGETMDTGADWETYLDSVGTRWALPDITFSNQISLHWGGPEIIVDHHPGPTPGASWVIIPDENVVFVGDAVVVDQPPFLANAMLETWLESLKTLASTYRNYTIISGRGGPVTLKNIQAYQSLLKKISKGLDRLLKRNASPESTEKLVPMVMEDLVIPKDQYEFHLRRLRHGLHQYYLKQYLSNSLV